MSEITYAGGLSVSEVQAQVKSEKVYKLSSNENPLGPSPGVVAAIQSAAPSLHLYPDRDDIHLRQALTAFHGRHLTENHFVSAVSGIEMIGLIARTFLQPEDEVIVCPPTFGWYVVTANRLRAKLVKVSLDATTFAHDVDAILAAVTEQTRLVYICNPHNPTGAMMDAADMAKLVYGLPERTFVVADEVYHHFVQRSDYPDSITHVLNGENVIILHSFSKAYGLAGLRLGYVIAKPELCAQIVGQKRPFQHSSLALAGGIAALQDWDHVCQTVALINEGKRYFYKQFETLGLAYWPSEANFVMFRPDGDADYVYQQLLEHGIMTRPTSKNGLPGYLRVTCGLPEANEAFIAALVDIMNM
jgi:histidinol-phosphate aminotransferase